MAPLPAPSQALPRELRWITAYWKPPGGLSPAGRCERLFHLSSWLLCLFSSFVKERQRKITETGTQRKPCKLFLVYVVQVSDNEVGSFCDRRLLFQGRPSQEGFIQWHEKLTKKTQRKYSNKTQHKCTQPNLDVQMKRPWPWETGGSDWSNCSVPIKL